MQPLIVDWPIVGGIRRALDQKDRATGLLLAGASAKTVRATLLAFFALSYAVTLASHAVTIGIPGPTWLVAGILIPFAFLGGLAGRPIGDRLGAEAFAILAIALLAGAGAYTLGAAGLAFAATSQR